MHIWSIIMSVPDHPPPIPYWLGLHGTIIVDRKGLSHGIYDLVPFSNKGYCFEIRKDDKLKDDELVPLKSQIKKKKNTTRIKSNQITLQGGVFLHIIPRKGTPFDKRSSQTQKHPQKCVCIYIVYTLRERERVETFARDFAMKNKTFGGEMEGAGAYSG